MFFGVFAKTVEGRGRAGLDGFVGEVAADVAGEADGGFVALLAVFVERLHDDPVELIRARSAECGVTAPLFRAPSSALRAFVTFAIRVLTDSGSSSRMMRCISAKPASRRRLASKGVVPVRSS